MKRLNLKATTLPQVRTTGDVVRTPEKTSWSRINGTVHLRQFEAGMCISWACMYMHASGRKMRVGGIGCCLG